MVLTNAKTIEREYPTVYIRAKAVKLSMNEQAIKLPVIALPNMKNIHLFPIFF